MKKLRALAILLLLATFIPRAVAQDKPKTSDAPNAELVKVTVVFSEYDGDKKISSLPYTLFLKVQEHRADPGKVRMGVRVPISIGGKDSQIQYQDIGSNIDCSAELASDGRYILNLSVERSSIYSGEIAKEEQPADQRPEDQVHQPSVRNFRATYALMLRDGQTVQGNMATDPLNGRVIKVDVTLNVLK